MDLGEFIWWMGCWILNRRNWWYKAEPTIYEGTTLRLNKYMSRTRFQGILTYLNYTDKGCWIL